MTATNYTNLDSGSNATHQTSQVTNSVTIPGYNLTLLAVGNSVASGTPNTPTVTGAGMTWVQVDTQTSGQSRYTLFRALNSNGGSGALTIDYGGQTAIINTWSIDTFNNVDTSGTNGSGAIVQESKKADVGTLTGATITLSAFSNANNTTYGSIKVDSNTVVTVGSGFTQLSNVNNTVSDVECTEWVQGNDTTVDWTWPSRGITYYAFAVEIKNGMAPRGGFIQLL